MWPQMVDVSSFILSMQIAQLSLYSSGVIGGTSFMKDDSSRTGFFRFLLCKQNRYYVLDQDQHKTLWGNKQELQIQQKVFNM